jgi:trehalose synthase
MLVPQLNRPLRLDDYREIAPEEQLDKVRNLAADLKGLRIVHVNSTADGGGVAEILRSLVPLMRDVGLDAQWLVMPGHEAFFEITKKLHNLMQGADGVLSAQEVSTYVAQGWKVSRAMQEQGISADIWVMHDPQSLPLAAFLPQNQHAMWVCHIDTTAPNQSAAGTLLPWLQTYPLIVFSLPQYILPALDPCQTRVAPPAIDPLLGKNCRPDLATARAIIARLGIDPERPLVSQVARFDVWKDPWGVIDAYRMVKREQPEVQLALLGVIAAQDDPEAFSIFDSVAQYAGDDPDIHLFTDGRQVAEAEVAAVQTAAAVIIQKSLREGFGLSVTEALWKGTPVIGGNCGGIRLQIIDGQTGFLVDTVEECAERMLTLLRDQLLAQRMGNASKEWVRQQFLTPRLLSNYLEFSHELLSGSGSFNPAINDRAARKGVPRLV